MNDEEFMKATLEEAKKSLQNGNYPGGCVIVKDGKILSRSQSPVLEKKDITAHAELLAIKEAAKKLDSQFLDNCILYASVEPCLMCAGAILYSRIKKVVYGSDHGEYGNKKTFDILKENGLGKDIEVVDGILKEESEKLVKEFFDKKIPIY